MVTWKDRFDREILQAQQARLNGNEGKARVCARRAAGIVITEFLTRQEVPLPSVSAYDQLRLLQNYPGMSPEVIGLVDHLTQRVTPEYTLPSQADLIADAQSLRKELLAEE